ncbi:MAG: hypothetical protein QOE73_23 [Verrucomicrobiota bacterium]
MKAKNSKATYRISRLLFRLSPWARGADKGEGLCRNRFALTLTRLRIATAWQALPSPFERERRSRETKRMRAAQQQRTGPPLPARGERIKVRGFDPRRLSAT